MIISLSYSSVCSPLMKAPVKMAAVDRFELLFDNILKTFSGVSEGLAIVGAVYTARKALKVSRSLLGTFNVHFVSRITYKVNLSKKFGTWAVVTGSSEGIGKAYARELAKRGMNIVLISRGENRLFKAAKEIEEEFKVETCSIAVDFAAGRETYSTIWEAIKDKEIGVLVNNVGVMYDYPQLFLDVPVERLWQIVNVNVAAATMMTHMILPQMVERGRGAVVMVSSGACSQITPQMTVYAGTKSFLDYFARALNYEYKGKGIIIQSLMPFYVNTRMTSYSSTLTRHNFLVPSATVFAQHAVATLGYSGRTSGYWPHTLQTWVSEMIPEWLWMWGATRLNNALRRQALDRLEKRALLKSQGSDSPSDEQLTPP